MTNAGRVSGGCNCGAVRFEGELSDRGVGVCHCKMCRRFASGPFMASRMVGGVTLTEESGLKWWPGSSWGERGFCGICGATLFWRMKNANPGDWAVSAGSLDHDPTQTLFEHIFSDRAPGFYAFADDAPRLTEAETFAKFAPKAEDGQAGDGRGS
ncbi:MAG: GFA family protein, partial [Rhodobacteraceae bacterium]|nr:GFA family protein [Paracoccaceae bacterium]